MSIAIVTGASKGIGAGIAQALADAGASVVVNYAGNQTDAGRVVHKITDAGGRAVAIQADVSNRKDVERLFSQTMAVLGAPDIIVNNAGVFSFQPLEEIAEAEFHRQFDVTVLGTILSALGGRYKTLYDYQFKILYTLLDTGGEVFAEERRDMKKKYNILIPAHWRKSWDREASASTRWRRVVSKQKARAPMA